MKGKYVTDQQIERIKQAALDGTTMKDLSAEQDRKYQVYQKFLADLDSSP
jgi:hypothetical protein